MKFLKRLFKIIFRTGLAISALIILLFLSFWIELKIPTTIPTPSGKYHIGRVSLHLTDTARLDSLSPEPFSNRELLVWIWYPSKKSKTAKLVDYISKDWSDAINDKRGFVLNNFFAREATKIQSHSFEDSEISQEKLNFPVLLMKSGIGSMASDYTAIAEEMASYGYIVVGSDSPYSTWLLRFPNGRIITRNSEGNPGETATISGESNRKLSRLVQLWSDDTQFILNQLEILNANSSSQFYEKLNLNAVGIFGHSFGGATAAQFCLNDVRCKAGVDMDGAPFGTVVEKGMNKPFMFLLADHINESDSISIQIKSNIAKIFHSNIENQYWIYLKGSGHFNFSDFPFQKEVFVSRLSGGIGPIGGKYGIKIITSCLLSFFDEYVKGEPSIKIQDLNKQFAEIIFAK